MTPSAWPFRHRLKGSTQLACTDLVRVRILKPLHGIVDGLSLSSLVPGFVYELPDVTAEQLLDLRAASPVSSTEPLTIDDLEDVDIAWLTGGVHVERSDTAHERSRRRRGKRRPNR